MELREHDEHIDDALEHVENLLQWLRNGGFAPTVDRAALIALLVCAANELESRKDW